MPMERLAQLVLELEAADPENKYTVADLPGDLRRQLLDQFLSDFNPWKMASQQHGIASRQVNDANRAAGDMNVTVLSERPEARKTHVLVRGVWDQHGEEVRPAVLSAVLPAPPESVRSRLELAKWVVSRQNPLTARVIVNHVWQLFFGSGLVRTPNDFGSQGEMPTHPDLLDWLAVDFMEHDWDFKHLVRQIVTSRTYQQDSRVTAELLIQDPENRLLARGARFRLPSWMIRDSALASSGLLNPAVGGPPMFAYQPPGVWQDQFMGRFTYKPTLGPGQYRRTLYTFWRRSSSPTFLFDSAMRRTCEVVPRLTNTPLHALTLLNDVTALESARTLAERGWQNNPEMTAESRIKAMFQTVLCRKPTQREFAVLMREYEMTHRYYEQHVAAALAVTSVGQLPDVDNARAIDVASEMLIASLILNLDESITHE